MANDVKDQLHEWMVLPSRMALVFDHIENTSQTMRDQKPSYILLLMVFIGRHCDDCAGTITTCMMV